MFTKRSALSLLVLLAACGPMNQRTTTPHPFGVVTASEIQSTNRATLYEAIQVARPEYLQSHGPYQVVVYLNTVRFGGIGNLRTLATGGIAEVRRLSASEANAMFGGSVGDSPVLQVITSTKY